MDSFKIKSKFYVIMGDDKPIYVGYTNRTVKQRFKEHLRDKDFSNYSNVEVVELSRYEKDFNFTWDYLIIQKDAEIVDNTERYLIKRYNTIGISYQKRDDGGPNWADVKHFVFSNKNNPKFKNMSRSKIEKYLKSEQKCMEFLSHFVSDMVFPEEAFLHNFVSKMMPSEKIFLGSFISNMKYPEEGFLNHFVSDMIFSEEAFLQGFISSMKYPEESFLNSFVRIMVFPEETFLYNFVNDMASPEKRFLKDFVKDMKYPEEMFLHNFVSNMIPTEKLFLSNFIKHMEERNND